MKLLPSLLLSASLAIAPAVLHAADFEGKIRMKMTEPRGGSRNLDYSIKPGLVRADIALDEKQNMTTIMNSAKKEVVVLMPGQNMYFSSSIDDVADVAAEHAGSLEKTGETTKILGYDCTKYVSRDKGTTTEIWATDELGTFAGISAGNPMSRKKSSGPGWEQALKGGNFFPLRVVSVNKKGKEEFRMEAVSIDKGSQPDSLFEIPAGYQQFNLGGLMKGLLPGSR